MARTDDDSWEITESVGATALGVAAARAAETDSDNPLIEDEFARVFLRAAGDGVWDWFAASDLPAQIADAEPDLWPRMQAMVDYVAARTAFFDTFFLDAAGAGIRRAVILAAGLDSRAWRLPWPGGSDGVTGYELDRPRLDPGWTPAATSPTSRTCGTSRSGKTSVSGCAATAGR